MHIVLEQAKLRIRHIGPGFVVASIGQCGARFQVGDVADRDLPAVIGPVRKEFGPTILRHELGAAAIVGKEEDQRIITDTETCQRRE